MTYNMFIDDERYPPNDDTRMWVICRNLYDVEWYVMTYGMPSFISFDHDLGEDQPTGYDIAKMLVEYDSVGNTKFVSGFNFYVHSQNPIGAKNIKSYLDNYFEFIAGY